MITLRPQVGNSLIPRLWYEYNLQNWASLMPALAKSLTIQPRLARSRGLALETILSFQICETRLFKSDGCVCMWSYRKRMSTAVLSGSSQTTTLPLGTASASYICSSIDGSRWVITFHAYTTLTTTWRNVPRIVSIFTRPLFLAEGGVWARDYLATCHSDMGHYIILWSYQLVSGYTCRW